MPMPPTTDVTLRIGELADAADVGVETVRFYERRGLLPAPPRTASGYRMYNADDVRRLRVIRRSRDLGFSLREIGELLNVGTDAGPQASCEPLMEQVRNKVAALDTRIAELQRMRHALQSLHDCCDTAHLEECRVLAALAGDDQDEADSPGTH